MQIKLSGNQEVYLEIANKYKKYIELGVLKNGDKLPSVRNQAAALGVNPNTIARAYAYLEKCGLIYSIPKKGLYISVENKADKENGVYDTKNAESTNTLSEFTDILHKLKEQGIGQEELITQIKEVFKND